MLYIYIGQSRCLYRHTFFSFDRTMAMVRAKKNIVSFLRELKPRKDTSRIEVRIIRLWRNYNKESGNTIEMVFVDKEISRSYFIL